MKVVLAPVRVGASLLRSNVTSPPAKQITHNLPSLDRLAKEKAAFLPLGEKN